MMISLSALAHLYAYDEWASERLLTTSDSLDPELWTRDLGSSFPSVRDTFAHLLSAEWLWLRRWQGDSPGKEAEWVRAPSPAALRSAMHEIHLERKAFMATLGDADLTRPIRYRRLNGEERTQRLGSLMLHVVNHSTYHRGQIVTLFRQLGVTPPSTDLLLYDLERPSQGR